MARIVWIIKQTDDITEWYSKESGIFNGSLDNVRGLRDSDLLWYESHVANYVARHAHMFSKSKLKNVWFEFQLGDKRTYSGIEKDLKPDLLLQFEKELWVVEVKYPDSWPDPETQKEVRGGIKQLKSYGRQLEVLIGQAGWFEGVEQVHLALFCAYKKKKDALSEQMRNASRWPIERRDSLAFSP